MPDPPTARRTLAPSLAAGFLAVACSWVLTLNFAVLARTIGGPNISYSVAIGLACAVTVPFVSRLVRRKDGGSTLRPASWVLLAWLPYLFGGAAFELSSPIIVGHWRCGTGDMGLVMIACVSVPFVFATTIVIARVVDGVRMHRAAQVAAWVVVGVSVVVLGSSLRRIRKPAPEDYVASLPVVAVLASDNARFDGPGFSVELQSPESADSAVGCSVALRDPAKPKKQFVTSCRGTRVLRDQEHGLWIFQPPPEAHAPNYAVDEQREGPEPVDVDVSTVGSSLRPPAVWIASLAGGCLLALAVLALAWRTRRRADDWLKARPGMHGNDGWVTFEDGTPPAHFAGAAALPSGQVLVLESARKAAHYREHGGINEGARFAEGTFDDVVQAAEVRATGLYAYAILIALLPLAPVLAAGIHGLLG